MNWCVIVNFLANKPLLNNKRCILEGTNLKFAACKYWLVMVFMVYKASCIWKWKYGLWRFGNVFFWFKLNILKCSGCFSIILTSYIGLKWDESTLMTRPTNMEEVQLICVNKKIQITSKCLRPSLRPPQDRNPKNCNSSL